MKILLLMCISTFLVLSACGSSNDSSTSENVSKDTIYQEKFVNKLDEAQISPELPQKIPYENYSKDISIMNSQKTISIMYIPQDANMGLKLEVFGGDVNLSGDGETLEIDQGKATYINADQAHILKWKKDNLSYTLSSPKNGELNKENLIEVANSFERLK
ncbi:DUF4367 domain-containing protein [Halobacillus hunanensis]|uniref:DUF4367 domain-containing protein n=1 Tax=Halobacillus hunanensis TaxID=578214 RepID=UPI0009A5ED2F|nr:DUF4367 domain-containing protein [Halobacillus hunanensis]